MAPIVTGQYITDFGQIMTLLNNPSTTFCPARDSSTNTDYHVSITTLLSGVTQNVIARLTPSDAGEYSPTSPYIANQSVHFTDPSLTNSGSYLATGAIAAGIAPPNAPWLLLSKDGKDGKSSIVTIGTTHPNIPAVGSSATYSADSNAGLNAGQYVTFGDGVLTVASLTGTTTISLTNVDAVDGAAVATGAKLVPAGKPGTNGTNGTSAIATASTFTQPAVNATVPVTVNSSAGFVDKQPLFHNLGGYYEVVGAPSNGTNVTLKNLGYAGNIAPAASVGAGTLVPSGLKGLDGSGSGHTIQEEGVNLAQRSKLNFIGSTATVTDDPVNDATVVTLTSSSGGASGLQYQYNTTAGTGVISADDLSMATTLTLGTPDAQGKVVSDVLARLKVGAIIEIAKDGANRVRMAVTTDHNSGSVGVAVAAAYGAIAAGDVVYLAIVSDAPSTVIGGQGRVTLTANRVYYVRSDGTRSGNLSSELDATQNLAADAFSTPELALTALTKIDCNGFIPTIKITTGTYPGINLKNLLGTDVCKWVGDGATNTIIGKISSEVLQRHEFSSLKINYTSAVAFDIAVDSNGGNIFLSGDCVINYSNTASSASQRGTSLAIRKGGIMTVGTGLTISGSSSWAVFCTEGSLFIAQSTTLNFTGSVSDFTFYAIGLGYIELGGANIIGLTPSYQKEGGGQIRLPSFGYA